MLKLIGKGILFILLSPVVLAILAIRIAFGAILFLIPATALLIGCIFRPVFMFKAFRNGFRDARIRAKASVAKNINPRLN